MKHVFRAIKEYIVLIRAYSVVDVILLFLLARMMAQGGGSYHWKDALFGFSVLCLWGLLSFSLEAKHKHSYRAHVPYVLPLALVIFASFVAAFVNISSLLFVGGTVLTTICYIHKETNSFWGKTSFLWRGLYEVFLFFFCYNLYKPVTAVGFKEICFGGTIFLFYAARNLIADIRDVAFDPLTLVVFWGSKRCYFIIWLFFVLGSVLLFLAFPKGLVALPGIIMSMICLLYDDSYALHRYAIIMTSFTSVNGMLSLQQSSLLYSHLLLLGIFSNFFFYEKVVRLSNPIARVSSQARFLFKR